MNSAMKCVIDNICKACGTSESLRRLSLIAFAFCVYIGQPLCGQEQRPAGSEQIPLQSEGLNTPIAPTLAANYAGIGDMVNVLVFDTPSLTGSYRVNDHGEIDFPLIGPVHVADLSGSAIAQLIQAGLMQGLFMNNPQVNVLIVGSGGHGISLLGEVSKAGLYSALGDTRLSTVISMAGGLSQTAGNEAKVYRQGIANPISVILRDASGEPAGANFALISGDTVVVQRASVIYVMGDVNKAGGFSMEHGHSTILQAMALAQGPTRTSKLHDVYLVRTSSQGSYFEKLDIDKIAKGKVRDVQLVAGDILYVPTSTMRVLTYGALPGLLSSVTSATIYSIR